MLEKFVRKGVEYDQTIKALQRWFSSEYNVVFAQTPSGDWIARNQRTRQDAGRYPTFAAMLIALLEQIKERD
jgi:hypothetical protein